MYPTFIDDIRMILKRCHDIERSLQRLSLSKKEITKKKIS